MFIYYEDQTEWGADDWYALYRYLDRLFTSSKPQRLREIEAMDPLKMSDNTKYLIVHLLALQRNLRLLVKQRNLAPILADYRANRLRVDLPIVLRDPPRHSWKYFKDNGIWL